MKRLILLHVLLCCLLISNAQRNNQKLNVLFIAADDLNCDIGTYGHSYVKTPNLDRLAKMGVQFNAAYNQYPLCSPSRSSIMTGLRPDSLQIYDLNTHFRTRFPNIVTLPQLFKNAGYKTARLGKIYHYGVPGEIGTNGLDDLPSWDTVINPSGRDKKDEHLVKNYTPQRGLGASIAWLEAEGQAGEQTDGLITTEAIRLLKEIKNEPFFLGVGYFRPHTPYIATSEYFDMYPSGTVKLPDSIKQDLNDVPDAALFTVPSHWGLSEEQRLIAMRAYYASVSLMDAQLGRLLDALEENDLLKNTVIVFWSDHGYHLGQHGQWLKQSLFEGSARVPLLIAGPGVKTDSKCNRTVELLDLYPTLAAICNLKQPAHLQGNSLLPLLRNPTKFWNNPAVTMVKRNNIFGYSVRTERWRYTEWDKGNAGIELYDHKNDPQEFHNLYNQMKDKKIVQELSALIRK